MTENEVWKDVVGYEGLYQVSNFGNVKSLDRKRFNGRVMANKKEPIKKQCDGQYSLFGEG